MTSKTENSDSISLDSDSLSSNSDIYNNNYLDNINYYENVEVRPYNNNNNNILTRRSTSSLTQSSIVTSNSYQSNISLVPSINNDRDIESNNHSDIESNNHSDIESNNHSDIDNNNHSDIESDNHSDIDNNNDSDIESDNDNDSEIILQDSLNSPSNTIEEDIVESSTTNNYNLTNYISTSSTGSTKNPCRICYQTVSRPRRYCKCSGSIAYIHFECLMNWLKTRRHQQNCEICHSKYFLERRMQKKYFTKDNYDYAYYPFLLLNLIFIVIFWLLIPSALGFIFKLEDNFTYVILIMIFNITFIIFTWNKFSNKLVPHIDYKIVFNPKLEEQYDRELNQNRIQNRNQNYSRFLNQYSFSEV